MWFIVSKYRPIVLKAAKESPSAGVTQQGAGKEALGDSLKMAIRSKYFSGRWLAIATVISSLAGCATTNVKQIDRLESVGEDPRILIMTPDIKYYLLTAGGIAEPHAEWTTAARANFVAAVKEYSEARDTELVFIGDQDQLGDTEIQYQKLYSAVGNTILINYFGATKLPSKGTDFDWTLGPGVQEIGARYNADYALFTYYRDYQASGGRIAFAVLAAAAGVGVPIGSESGFASLVDLKSGDIVWFNRVIGGAGELRDSKGAVTAVNMLFRDLPER